MSLTKLPTKMSAGFGLSMIDRAVKEFHAERCTASDLTRLRSYFEENGGLVCIYCQSSKPTRWDHLHPVSKGGDTVPGNLVPACGSCDDSKQDRDVEDWIASTSSKRPPLEHSDRILSLVQRYRAHFKYTPKPFTEKLTRDELRTYESVQAALSTLRSHLEKSGHLKRRK